MIIGIGGVSTSGKSWIAQKITDHYRNKKTVSILCQDDYTLMQDKIPVIRDHVDWEIPGSMDFEKFYRTILKESKKSDVVIAEGLFVFYQEQFVNLYDKMICFTLKKETFLERKRKDLRWGKEPEWYIEHIWESHLRFRESAQVLKKALVVPGEYPVDIERILSFVDS